jgi:hypothetical protein
MSAISQFLIPGSSQDGQYILDKKAFNEFARARALASATRNAEDTKAGLDKFNRLLSSAAGVAQLNSIDADYETLNIYRDSPALDFLQMRNWPIGTIAIFRTKTQNPVNVLQGGILGVGPTHYYANSQTVLTVAPTTITTERVMTPNLNNLYDMEKLMQRRDAETELSRYLEQGMVNMALNTVLANSSSVSIVTDDPAVSLVNYFNTGGSFAGQNVYVLNPGVVSAYYPTVNCYDLTSEGGLTKKVFQTINTHSIQIGRNFNRMYIPSGATGSNAPVWESLQAMATPVSLVTGGLGNTDSSKSIPAEMWSEFQKEDFKGEIVINWFGSSVSVRKQNWMPAGYCLLFSEEPAALMWDRLTLEGGPAMDGTLETPMDGFFSYKSRSRQVAFARPGYALRNFLVIKCQ